MVRRLVTALTLVLFSVVAAHASNKGMVDNLQGKIASLQVGQSTFQIEAVLGEAGAFTGRRGNLAYLYCETRASDTLYATVFFVDGAYHSTKLETRAEVITRCDSAFPRVNWDDLVV